MSDFYESDAQDDIEYSRQYSNFSVSGNARVINGNVNDERHFINHYHNNRDQEYYDVPDKKGSWGSTALVAGGVVACLVGGSYLVGTTTDNAKDGSRAPTLGMSLPEPANNPSVQQRQLYITTAGRLPSVEREIESWDTNGISSRYPELRREPFVEKIVATYVQHFKTAGLQQPPHILVLYDRVKIEERHLIDAVDPSGTVHSGPSDKMFAHHKMACWKGSANHYGYNVYVFLSGHIIHAGGGKGFGNWRWHSHQSADESGQLRLFDRKNAQDQTKSGAPKELVTFRTPF